VFLTFFIVFKEVELILVLNIIYVGLTRQVTLLVPRIVNVGIVKLRLSPGHGCAPGTPVFEIVAIKAPYGRPYLFKRCYLVKAPKVVGKAHKRPVLMYLRKRTIPNKQGKQ
jgi:hypothetical protein